jgi:mono/diheme cytochrome c family protein
MRGQSIIRAAVLAAAVATTGVAGAAQKEAPADPGKREYDANCSSCHGPKGRGDGPNAKDLKTRPGDLAQLARRNGGVFPINRVYDIVDGRQQVKAHGQREMPVWGLDYSVKGVEQGKSAQEPNLYVRTRILELIDYLYRLQVK